MESRVRRYCRHFPATFQRAKGPYLVADDGTTYIDFFCGAGSLNYGHNPDQLKTRLLEYLQEDGLIHALDMHTTAKREFLTRFREVVLEPRGLAYKVQFCGPGARRGRGGAQAGPVVPASPQWLRRLRQITSEYDVLEAGLAILAAAVG